MEFNWVKLAVVVVLVNDAATFFMAARWIEVACHFFITVAVMLAWKRGKVFFVDR